jgi:aromatic-L-amino-acid decarboxylase
LFTGISQADSVSVDAHKWMFVPKACGVVMVRDRNVLQAAFGHETSYLPGSTNPVDSTLEYSRPLRALKLWLALRVHGASAFRHTIIHNIELAQFLKAQAHLRPEWTVGPMGELSIALLRREGVDNGALVEALQSDGRVFVSHARIGDEIWIRPCFTNPRSTRSDAIALLDVADELAERLAGDPAVL